MSVAAIPVTTLYPARTGSRPLTAEDLWALPRVGSPVPGPDGTWCVVPVTTYDLEKNEGRTRLWRIPAGGGEPLALTSAELSSTDPAVSPDGRRLAFCRKAAAGKPQLYMMPLDGGEPRKLTELPLGVFDPRFMPDGTGIVFAAPLIKGHLTPEATAAEIERRDKDPVKAHVTEERLYRFWDQWLTTGEVPHLFLYDLRSEALRDLTPQSTVWFDWMEPAGQYDIAPDGREVAFAGTYWDSAKAIVRSAIYVAPVAGGAVQCLTPDHPATDSKPRYAPDGNAIVYGMTHDPDFYADRVRIMRYDRAASTHVEAITGWDRSPSEWRPAADGALYLVAEDRARVSLFQWRGSGAPKPVVNGGTVGGLAIAGGRVFFTHQTLAQPSEAFTCALDGGEPRRLTRFTDDVMSRVSTGEVREMQFEGAKGETVQMFVVLPPGFTEGEQRPLVHVVHGGPHGISGDVFHMRWNPQLFAAPGYVAAMVNFQGSTSWGQDFAQRIQGAWTERPFEDVMRATDTLIAAGIVDRQRMAAAGGSYGGYMAAWIAGHTDRFRCIINHAGVYDTLAQYASDWTMGRGKAWGGEAWDGLEAIEACNPARFAKHMVTPMLVLHGERDYRVPASHALECYGVLKGKGVPARLVYFPDENHWVLKPRNSILWNREVHTWLKRWLGA